MTTRRPRQRKSSGSGSRDPTVTTGVSILIFMLLVWVYVAMHFTGRTDGGSGSSSSNGNQKQHQPAAAAAAAAANNPINPWEGYQPKPYADEDMSQCTSVRTCFKDKHKCPGLCRDAKDAAPSVPDDWIPDVTMLRRMMLSGVDSNGDPWPPPLVAENNKEFCEPMDSFGNKRGDINMDMLEAVPVIGMPLVPPAHEQQSQRRPKILCMVYTMETAHHDRIRAIRETWAGGCDGFLAFSTKSDPRIPAISLPHEGPEEYNNMWQKVRSIWKFVGTHYLEDFDFFFQGGDDLYVLPENLRNYLGKAVADPEQDFFAGRR
ncbi:MAG: hypothetical protein SGILL_004443 [Bacillariaceae sp.]